MKIKCNREELQAAFQLAAAVAPSRSPKAILENVKFEAADGKLILSATDLEVSVRVEAAGVEIEQPGVAALPVDRFGSLLRESSDESISIEADDQGAVVRGDRSEFKLPAVDPAEFPNIAGFEAEAYQETSARFFKELAKRTMYATDPESTRYALGGVLLEFEADKMIGVGTDGRRLAKMEGPATAHGGHENSDTMTIIPTRAMQLIERTLQDSDAEVQIAARANEAIIKTPRATLKAQLVEGRFPKWRDVLPNRPGATQIEMTVGPMFAAVRQAAIVATSDSRGIDFTFGEGSLVLSGSTADRGQSRVELPIPYDGEKITVTLDHRFVADFLKTLDIERAFRVELENSAAAVVCRTDDGYAYVIMPLARDK